MTETPVPLDEDLAPDANEPGDALPADLKDVVTDSALSIPVDGVDSGAQNE